METSPETHRSFADHGHRKCTKFSVFFMVRLVNVLICLFYFYLFISLNSWFMTNWHAKCERGVIANHGKKRKERNIEKEFIPPPPPFWYVDEETEQNFKEEGAIRFEGSPNFNAFRPESVIALENFLQKGKYPIDSICNLKAI